MSLQDIFSSVVSLQNPDGNPKLNSGYREVNWNHKVASENLDVASQELADWVRSNSASVRNELDLFTAARLQSPAEHAIRCFVFSLLSPQTNFEENVLATQNVLRNWMKLTDAVDILDCLTIPFHGSGAPRLINLGLSKAQYLYEALPWLDRLNDDNLGELFTYDYIHGCKGFAEKTTSMALALFDQENQVFTLDQWMIRLSLALNNHDPRAIIRPTKKGYKTTEQAWLTFCKQYLPDMTPFCVQFTLWCGAFGGHKSHLGILA